MGQGRLGAFEHGNLKPVRVELQHAWSTKGTRLHSCINRGLGNAARVGCAGRGDGASVKVRRHEECRIVLTGASDRGNVMKAVPTLQFGQRGKVLFQRFE